jgi:DNA repair protein RadC
MKITDNNNSYKLTSKPNADDIIDLAKRILAGRYRPGFTISSPSMASDYFKLHLGGLDREVFNVVYLSAGHQVLAIEALFVGTIDVAEVHPREVIKGVIRHRASAVLFCHNHPSGNCKSSQSDRAVTTRLKQALNLIDVRVLDHLIVTATDSYSMAEHGEI